ncbi:unnamed protein product, partial [Protopolystoma xenopodis]
MKTHICGTPNYLAPEIFFLHGHSFASDYWAAGVTLYFMLVGRPPFQPDRPVDRPREGMPTEAPSPVAKTTNSSTAAITLGRPIESPTLCTLSAQTRMASNEALGVENSRQSVLQSIYRQ